jgi:hypothetical protein
MRSLRTFFTDLINGCRPEAGTLMKIYIEKDIHDSLESLLLSSSDSIGL